MGVFDFFISKNQIGEYKIALVAGYVFSQIEDESLRESIHANALELLCTGGFKFDRAFETFNNSPAIVQAGLLANSMIDKGIHHKLRGFSWDYIRNPFLLKTYSKRAFEIAIQELYDDYGFNPDDCFRKQII